MKGNLIGIFQLLPQGTHETQRKFSSAKDDVTPLEVNGDPSTLTDQRIPTEACECSVSLSHILRTHTLARSLSHTHTHTGQGITHTHTNTHIHTHTCQCFLVVN